MVLILYFQKLPKVNRNLAEKLMIEDEEGTNKKKKVPMFLYSGF